ncbi:MAG: hypothetical protein VKK32_01455 [Candidatus Melainabacteria bacterium]|nr:hypothetical protein [Candidatus Melainabacteria bacterium]
MAVLTDSLRVYTSTTAGSRRQNQGLRVVPACPGGFCSETPLVSKSLSLPVPPVYTGLTGRTKRNPKIDSMIFKRYPLKPKDFQNLKEILAETLNIPVDSNIVYASNGGTHKSAWVRDMAAISQSMRDTHEDKIAAKMMQALYEAYNSNQEREKIDGLNGSQAQDKWAPEDGDASKTVPSTKFSVTESIDPVDNSKKLIQLNHPWGHQQLDAYGYFLQELTILAKNGKFDLKEFDNKVKKGKNHENSESTLVAMVRMLKNIRYEDNYDLGAWESHWQKARLSSIAAVVSGLVSVQEYYESRKDTEVPNIDNPRIGLNRQRFEHELETAIKQGKDTIQKRLNEEIIQEIPEIKGTQEARNADAALLFMLAIADPEKIGITREQEKKILNSVYSLMGELGFRRFEDDNYMSRDWISNKYNREHNHNGEFGDLKNPKDAAEWSMFDPYLASVNYRLFLRSVKELATPDWAAYARADAHAKRTLAHITPDNFVYERKIYQANGHGEIREAKVNNHIPAQKVLESYFRVSREDGGYNYMPGENEGLNWTKAAMKQMLEIGERASAVHQDIKGRYQSVINNLTSDLNSG